MSCSTTRSGSAGGLARSLALILYDQPVSLPKQPVGAALSQRIEAEGLDAAVAFYRTLRAGDDDGYDVGEDQLNALGYVYLERGDIETAVRLFELNVEAYPEASNPYDSLGEAVLAAGDTARATAHYQRSLDLNPANDNAREVLASLGVTSAPATVEVSEDVLDRYVGQLRCPAVVRDRGHARGDAALRAGDRPAPVRAVPGLADAVLPDGRRGPGSRSTPTATGQPRA